MGRLTETARWKRCVPRARLPIYAQASSKKDDPNWQRVWNIVNDNKQVLIQYWDSHYDDIVKRFHWLYDGLF